jgi:two-component system response regulator YesN
VQRILILDDEPLIVDGLYEHLREVRGDEVELYRSYSAAEALGVLERLRIDVLVSDIRMPVMSGLELLEIVKRQWPRCRMLFLTGYDSFEYIYAASRYDGVSYLLKTEGYDRIVAEIDRHRAEIERETQGRVELDRARALLREMLPRLREEYLTGLLDGTIDSPDPARFTELEIPLDTVAPVVLCLGFCLPRADGAAPGPEPLTALRLTTEVQLRERGVVASAVVRDGVAILLQAANGTTPPRSTLQGMLEMAAGATELGTGFGTSFVADAHPIPWEELAVRCDELRRCWYRRADRPVAAVLGADTGPAHGCRRDHGRAASRLKACLARLGKLELMLDRGDRAGFRPAFDAILAGIVAASGGYPDLAAGARAALSLFFLTYLRANELADVLHPRALVERLERPDSVAVAGMDPEFYRDVADAVFRQLTRDGEDRARAAIERVKHHVDEHLDDDLSLERMADVAYFCPKYLSRVFKQITGSGYLEYVSERRLAKARELLHLRDWKISRVGAAIGYRSPPYFTRFFKRLTGLTPQEFRQSVAGERAREDKGVEKTPLANTSPPPYHG